MTVFFRRSVFCMLQLAAALMLAMHNEVVSQDAAPTGEGEANATKPGEIKTLDQVRQLGTLGTDAYFDLLVLGEGSVLAERLPDPRKTAMKKIEEAKAELNSNEDRSKVEPFLRAALAEYFIADMQHRVRELDEIKAKVAESEAKLQKRLDSQQESVDLQLKLMLREADGQGFFRKEDASGLTIGIPGATADSISDLSRSGNLSASDLIPSVPPHEEQPVAPDLQTLTKILAKTQTLVLVVHDNSSYNHRLPASFDDESFKQLAGALLKALFQQWDRLSITSNHYILNPQVRDDLLGIPVISTMFPLFPEQGLLQ